MRRGADLEPALALYARAALAASFLAAVADRLGVCGPPGTTNVAWGDMRHFQAYAQQLNPWFPASVIPALSWVVTAAETSLAACLLAGFQVRWAAGISGALLLAFATGMTVGTGVKSALNASVFSASACALLLWRRSPDPPSLDHWLARRREGGRAQAPAPADERRQR
jgi:uncharacterized membrane protein YphA (DoxX/SURF4 family)